MPNAGADEYIALDGNVLPQMFMLQVDLQVALALVDFLQNEDGSLDFEIKGDPNWLNLVTQYSGLPQRVMSQVGSSPGVALMKERDFRKLLEIGDQVFPKCQDPVPKRQGVH